MSDTGVDQDEWSSNPLRNRDFVAGVVLAGGLSRRMGGTDKCLMQLAGKEMIAHAVERLEQQTSKVVINSNSDATGFEPLGLPIAPDLITGHIGPLAGVLTGMRWARENAPKARWIVTAPADTPFLPDDLVNRLIAAAGHNFKTIALACSGGRVHPVVGIWPVDLADDLEEFLITKENRKVLAFVERHTLARVEFRGTMIDDIEIDPFYNVNSPEDLAVAEAVLAELAENTE